MVCHMPRSPGTHIPTLPTCTYLCYIYSNTALILEYVGVKPTYGPLQLKARLNAIPHPLPVWLSSYSHVKHPTSKNTQNYANTRTFNEHTTQLLLEQIGNIKNTRKLIVQKMGLNWLSDYFLCERTWKRKASCPHAPASFTLENDKDV